MISIVIPLYDKAGQVTATLDSVRQQVFAAYEVIIVDDGSQDGSVEIVKAYLAGHEAFARKVRLFEQPHKGVSAARNRGIQEAIFEWIAFLDADDIWASGYLQNQYELSLKYPACQVLASGYSVLYGGGRCMRIKLSKLSFATPDGIMDNYFEVAACSYPPLSSLATIAKKQALLAIGGFPEGISSGEDLLTWARLAVRCKIAYHRDSLAFYDQDASHHNKDQRTRMPARQDLVGQHLLKLYQQYPHIPGLKQYVGMWHKMRTRIYLTHAMKKEAWAEWRKLVKFNPVHYKTWAYLLMLVSPVRTFQ